MRHFTVADPRTFDGNVFEVAERAVQQASSLAVLLSTAIADAEKMACNAQMTRDLEATNECDAAGFADSAQGRAFAAALSDAAGVQRRLDVLTQAAGYNPKAPLELTS